MDMMQKYPDSEHIQYWGLAMLLKVHGSLEGPKRDQISGPVWLIATDILVRHEQAPFDTEVQSALLSAFAHLGIAGSSPVQDRHLDFALGFLDVHAAKLMPIQMEEVLQIFLV